MLGLVLDWVLAKEWVPVLGLVLDWVWAKVWAQALGLVLDWVLDWEFVVVEDQVGEDQVEEDQRQDFLGRQRLAGCSWMGRTGRRYRCIAPARIRLGPCRIS